jgi:hypothetical protein
MRSVAAERVRTRNARRLFGDTAERYAADERTLEHPYRRAVPIGLGMGFTQWAIAWHHNTRAWAIALALAASLMWGYTWLHSIRSRHRRSQFFDGRT